MKTLEKSVGQMVDIRHLLQEITRLQRDLRPLGGAAREKLVQEWQEISATLDTKMQAAKYFNFNDHMYLKYVSVQTIEYVDTILEKVGFNPFNAFWMDMLQLASITSRVDYQLAVDAVLEKGGPDNG